MIQAYILTNSAEEAEAIAIDLLEKKLVYSINIISEIKSMRRENNKIIKLNRTIMLAKTKSLLYKKLEEEVQKVQTTGTAIVFSMPITQMSQNLFDNIQSNTLKVKITVLKIIKHIERLLIWGISLIMSAIFVFAFLDIVYEFV